MTSTLLRAMLQGPGRILWGRVVPLWLALALPAGIVFSPLGMRAADALDALDPSPFARLVVGLLWVFAHVPGARALFHHPSAFFLRAQPVSRRAWVALHVGLLALTQLPAVGFVLRGRSLGPGLGFGAWSLAMLLVLAQRRTTARTVLAGAALSVGLFAWPPTLALGAAALALIPWLGGAAWDHALEHSAHGASPALSRHGALALTACHLRGVFRMEPTLVLRLLTPWIVCAAIMALALRNNPSLDTPTRLQVALCLASPCLFTTNASLARAIHASERALSPLLAWAAPDPRTLRASAWLASALGAAFSALLLALPSAWVLPRRDGAAVVALVTLSGALLAAPIETLQRRLSDSIDAERLASVLMALWAADLIASLVLGQAVVGLVAAVTVAVLGLELRTARAPVFSPVEPPRSAG